MAYSSTWIFTDIPKDIVEIIQKDLKVFEKQFKENCICAEDKELIIVKYS